MNNEKIKQAVLFVLWLLALFTALLFATRINECFGAERVGINAKEAGENNLYRATCRVYNGNIAGSGAVFHQDDDGNLYVLTNYHVAQKNNCTLHFVVDGEIVRAEALNIWQGYNEQTSLDAVVLKLPFSAVKEKTNKLGFVPFWNSKESKFFSGEESMITVGSPKAQWPKYLEGRINFKGTGTAEFKPTPYGGQSGSAIFITRNNRFYIGALLTWRQDEEGTEGFGGLAQPIGRVIDAMNGAVSETGEPLPDHFIECPAKTNKAEVIYIGKEKRPVIPVATDSFYIEFWECVNCSWCEKAKQEWLPALREKANVVVLNGSGKNADYAKKAGVSNYPTVRVINNKTQYKVYTGYSEENFKNIKKDLEVLANLYNAQPDEENAQGKGESEPENNGVDSIDDSCRLFGGKCQPSQKSESITSGLLPFKLPFSDEETPAEPENKPDGGGIIKKLVPKQEKPIIKDSPKNQPFGNIKNKLDKGIKNKLEELSVGVFWLCFFACTLALATYKFTIQIAKCLWWGIKKLFEIIAGKFALAVYNVADKVAEKVAETVKQAKTTKETK